MITPEKRKAYKQKQVISRCFRIKTKTKITIIINVMARMHVWVCACVHVSVFVCKMDGSVTARANLQRLAQFIVFARQREARGCVRLRETLCACVCVRVCACVCVHV
jgi:hypothetical protein